MKRVAILVSPRGGPLGLALAGLLLCSPDVAGAQAEPPPDGAGRPPAEPDGGPAATPDVAPEPAEPDESAGNPGAAPDVAPEPAGDEGPARSKDPAPEPNAAPPPNGAPSQPDDVVSGPSTGGMPSGAAAGTSDAHAKGPNAPEPIPGVVDRSSAKAPLSIVEAPQDPSEDAPTPPRGDEEEVIVVTGSRIKRPMFGSGPPIMSMNREQIQQTGAHNVEDLIQNLTIAAGSGYRGGGSGPSSTGTAAINLRGLGPGSTLVLLNGRRMVPSAQGISQAYVDISTVPLAVVERIDILKTGASAIYGTDALAGVINIITRTDWEGLLVQTDGRATTKGFDQREATASVAIGASGENARVIGGLSYYRMTPLSAVDRAFTREEGPPGGQGGNRTTTGNPSSYVTAGGVVADPDCLAAPGARIEESAFGPLCTTGFNEFRWLTPDQERTAAYLGAEYDISDSTRAFLEVNVSKMRVENISSPSLPPAVRPTVPADHVDNPFGSDAISIGRPMGVGERPVTTSADDDTLRVALGLQGDLGGLAANTTLEDWEWNLTTTFGTSRYSRVFPDTIAPKYQEALNACSDPSDLSRCFNPFYSSVLGTGTPNSNEVIEGFTGALQQVADQHLQTYGAGLTGSMFPLPGGNAAFALGAELRREQRSSELDHNSNQRELSFYFGNSDAYAERDIGAEYLELVWPFVNGLELQTAGRAEQYPAENQVSWSAGFTANPGRMADSQQQILRGLTFRGSVSKAFRAPTLFQTFTGATTITAALDDGGPVPERRPVGLQGNPDLEGEHARSFNAGFTWQPIDELMLGLDFWNYTIENYIVAENAQGVLAAERASGIPDPRVRRDAMGALQGITVSLTNVPGDITIRGIDGSAMARFDTALGDFSLGAEGSLMLGFRIPRELVSNVEDADGNTVEPPFCNDESCDVAGNFNESNVAGPLPVLRLNLPIGWEMDEHSVGFIVHFMSGLEDWAPARYDSDGSGPRGIDSFTTVDFQYSFTLGYVIGRLTKLRVGIINMLNQAPPFVDVLDTYATALHDPRGRMVYASLTQEL